MCQQVWQIHRSITQQINSTREPPLITGLLSTPHRSLEKNICRLLMWFKGPRLVDQRLVLTVPLELGNIWYRRGGRRANAETLPGLCKEQNHHSQDLGQYKENPAHITSTSAGPESGVGQGSLLTRHVSPHMGLKLRLVPPPAQAWRPGKSH